MAFVEDLKSSNFLATDSRVTYIGYIRLGKMIIEHRSVIPTLARLGKDMLVAKTIGSTDPDDLGLYISFAEDIHFIIQTTDTFVIKDHKPAPFHATTFCWLGEDLLNELHARHLRKEKQQS